MKIWRNLEKTKLNESGRQKLGRCRRHASRHSIQSYIVTYYMYMYREPLIALGFHQGGALISASVGHMCRIVSACFDFVCIACTKIVPHVKDPIR